MSLPYETASSGKNAIGEIEKVLRRFGCSSIGHMMDYDHGELLLQFRYRERNVSVKASINGYAAAWLRENPWTSRRRATKVDWEREAKRVGSLAVYSILRDWIKGQITAVETGMLTFEGAFLGQLLLPNGTTVFEHLAKTDVLRIEGPRP